MGLTNGQNTVLKSDTRMKASFSGLSPQRQVRAIRMWMNANNKTKGSELETWPAKKDEEVRSHIVNIADYLGIDVGHPDFRRELLSVRSGHEYKTISGEFGTVPAEIVEAVCETYKIKEGVIREAVNHMAAPKGDNGVKTVTHDTYGAELKLMAMGDYRVFARKTTGTSGFVFDTIRRGLH